MFLSPTTGASAESAAKTRTRSWNLLDDAGVRRPRWGRSAGEYPAGVLVRGVREVVDDGIDRCGLADPLSRFEAGVCTRIVASPGSRGSTRRRTGSIGGPASPSRFRRGGSDDSTTGDDQTVRWLDAESIPEIRGASASGSPSGVIRRPLGRRRPPMAAKFSVALIGSRGSIGTTHDRLRIRPPRGR